VFILRGRDSEAGEPEVPKAVATFVCAKSGVDFVNASKRAFVFRRKLISGTWSLMDSTGVRKPDLLVSRGWVSLQVLIPGEFKSCVLEVLILKALGSRFS
jgi:hypothetical protein